MWEIGRRFETPKMLHSFLFCVCFHFDNEMQVLESAAETWFPFEPIETVARRLSSLRAMLTNYDVDWFKLLDSAIQNGAAVSKDSFNFFGKGLLLTKLSLQNTYDHSNGTGNENGNDDGTDNGDKWWQAKNTLHSWNYVCPFAPSL